MQMKFIKNTITFVLSALICAQLLHFPITSNASRNKSERVVVSLGDSYSSGEGLEPYYGQDISRFDIANNEEIGYDWLAHRSKGSWPGQLEIDGIGQLSSSRNDHWFFEAVSGAETKNLGVSSEYFDNVIELFDTKLSKGVISKEEYDYHIEKINKLKKKGEWKEQQDKSFYYLADPNNITDVRYYTATLPYQLDVFDKLEPNSVEYVTMTMGGNDIGFADIVNAASIKGSFDVNGLFNKLYYALNTFDETTKYRLYASYYAIQEKAGEQAKIIIAGYPLLFSEDALPQMLFPGIQFLFPGGSQTRIPKYASYFNKMIRNIVDDCRINGGLNIYFVSVAGNKYFGGHEAYTKDPYIKGIQFGASKQDLDTSEMISAASMHPNEKGAKAYADAVQVYIDKFENNGLVSGFLYNNKNGELMNVDKLKEKNLAAIRMINTSTGESYDIFSREYDPAWSTPYIHKYGYYEEYIPEGQYKIEVEYNSNKDRFFSIKAKNKKHFVKCSGDNESVDLIINVEKGKRLRHVDFCLDGNTPEYLGNTIVETNEATSEIVNQVLADESEWISIINKQDEAYSYYNIPAAGGDDYIWFQDMDMDGEPDFVTLSKYMPGTDVGTFRAFNIYTNDKSKLISHFSEKSSFSESGLIYSEGNGFESDTFGFTLWKGKNGKYHYLSGRGNVSVVLGELYELSMRNNDASFDRVITVYDEDDSYKGCDINFVYDKSNGSYNSDKVSYAEGIKFYDDFFANLTSCDTTVKKIKLSEYTALSNDEKFKLLTESYNAWSYSENGSSKQPLSDTMGAIRTSVNKTGNENDYANVLDYFYNNINSSWSNIDYNSDYGLDNSNFANKKGSSGMMVG